jgi:hypothetical protein
MRDFRRQIDLIPPGTPRETVIDTLVLVSRLLHQAPRGGAFKKNLPHLQLILFHHLQFLFPYCETCGTIRLFQFERRD